MKQIISDQKIVHVRPSSRDRDDAAGQRQQRRRHLDKVPGKRIDLPEKRIRILARTGRRRSDLRTTPARSLPDRVPRQAPLGQRHRCSRVPAELRSPTFKICESYFDTRRNLHQILFVIIIKKYDKIIIDSSKIRQQEMLFKRSIEIIQHSIK